jgi:hypothetical protein
VIEDERHRDEHVTNGEVMGTGSTNYSKSAKIGPEKVENRVPMIVLFQNIILHRVVLKDTRENETTHATSSTSRMGSFIF